MNSKGSMGNITIETSESTDSDKPEKLGRARSCLFVVNNYNNDDIEHLRNVSADASYLVWSYELAPSTGTPHIQGFIQWPTQRSLDKFSNSFSKHAFVKRPNGTAQQNATYVKKPETKDPAHAAKPWEEYGEVPIQGKRTDWDKVWTSLKDKKSIVEVLEDQPHLIPCQRAIREVKMSLLTPIHRDVEVYVLVGKPGTGKTRWAYDQYPTIYSKPRGDWWDGYVGEKAVLLDDYYGFLPYCDLLRVLDRYPLTVPVKGSFVAAQWNVVVITSNQWPWNWYKNISNTDALKRRIKVLYEVQNTNETSTYTPIETWGEEVCEEITPTRSDSSPRAPNAKGYFDKYRRNPRELQR